MKLEYSGKGIPVTSRLECWQGKEEYPRSPLGPMVWRRGVLKKLGVPWGTWKWNPKGALQAFGTGRNEISLWFTGLYPRAVKQCYWKGRSRSTYRLGERGSQSSLAVLWRRKEQKTQLKAQGMEFSDKLDTRYGYGTRRSKCRWWHRKWESQMSWGGDRDMNKKERTQQKNLQREDLLKPSTAAGQTNRNLIIAE